MKTLAPALSLIAIFAVAPTFAGSAVDVAPLRAVPAENGLFRVQAELNNRSADTRQVFYRFRWVDKNGFPAWEDEAWKPLTVYGMQRLMVSTVSPLPGVHSYSMEIFEKP